MEINVQILREMISQKLKEVWNDKTRSFDTVDRSKEDEAEAEKYDKKLKRNASYDDYEENISSHFDAEIKRLMQDPEFESIESFVDYKIDDEETTFSAAELQALARNLDYKNRKIKNALPPQALVDQIKNELISYGLKFVPRQALKNIRGAMSSAHGTSPYAGFGGGGSGMGSNREGPMGFGIGGGPGVMASGEKWDANDPKNLRMGLGLGKKK